MIFLITFLEGIITFISPCMLPMLPIYVSYFAGNGENHSTFRTLLNACGFVLGFTTVFVLLGAFAGTLGSFLQKYQTILNVVTGLIVVFLGLHFLGVFNFNLFKGLNNSMSKKDLGFFSSMIFGMIFSCGWTPCVGAFLGSALVMASQQGKAITGIIMLLSYSMGLGIPFVISAVIVDKLKSTFDFIKKHYLVINKVCGCLLIVVGILMATGMMGKYLSILS